MIGLSICEEGPQVGHKSNVVSKAETSGLLRYGA